MEICEQRAQREVNESLEGVPDNQHPRIPEVVQFWQGDINYFDKSINSYIKLLLISCIFTVQDSFQGACPSP